MAGAGQNRPYPLISQSGRCRAPIPGLGCNPRSQRPIHARESRAFRRHREARGAALFAKGSDLDFKGIVAKQANSVCKAGGPPEWDQDEESQLFAARGLKIR
jgi:hypothetical protein